MNTMYLLYLCISLCDLRLEYNVKPYHATEAKLFLMTLIL